MYMDRRGASVLDYTGVVQSVEPAALWPRLTIRYSDGEIRTTSAHPDFVIPMGSAIAYARRFHATAPVTAESVAAILRDQGHHLSMLELIRVVWVLRFDPDALLEAGTDQFVPVAVSDGTPNQ